MENAIEYLKTADIKTSAYLLVKGIPLVSVQKDDPRKIIFCFVNEEKVRSLLNDFWSGKALVNPRALFEKLDYLKDLIHRDYEI